MIVSLVRALRTLPTAGTYLDALGAWVIVDNRGVVHAFASTESEALAYAERLGNLVDDILTDAIDARLETELSASQEIPAAPPRARPRDDEPTALIRRRA